MRVIAGRLRGRPLEAPAGRTTRPITDRVKETLFNILGHRLAVPGELPAVAVLDVFAGPGSLGIEALSRGARRCTFVENDRAVLRILRHNIRRLAISELCTVVADNAWTLRAPRPLEGFGLVFVDPPYREAQEPWRVVDLLERLGPSLAADGLLVFRHEARGEFRLGELRTLRVLDDRRVAHMRLVILARREDAEVGGTPGAPSGPRGGMGDLARREQVEEEHSAEDVRHDADGQLGDG